MNKKGQSGFEPGYKWLYYLVFVVVVSVAGVFFFAKVGGYANSFVAYDDDFAEELYFQKMVYCFSYEDSETGRVYPWLIDRSKFNQDRFEECFPSTKGVGIYASLDGESVIKIGKAVKELEGREVVVYGENGVSTLRFGVNK